MPYRGTPEAQSWDDRKCPVCKGEAKLAPNEVDGQDRFSCRRCGVYVLASEAQQYYSSYTGVNQILSGAIRHACEAGYTLPVLDQSKANELEDRAPRSVPLKARGLPHYLANKTDCPGDPVWLKPKEDLAVVYGRTAQELSYFSDYLRDVKWIEDYRHESTRPNETGCVLTTQGWTEVEADGRGGSTAAKPSSRCRSTPR